MHILWLDPFHGGSHAAVAAGYAARSAHTVTLVTLPTSGGWRWRMRGGAVSLARMVRGISQRPDLIIASDMLDLATFRALTADQLAGVPAAVYFHENQLTYPLPPGRQRDLSFAWTNITTALGADAVLFNSDFHRREFLDALPRFLSRYYDYQELDSVALIAAKSRVLAPGIDLASLAAARPRDLTAQPPAILWNSRWEYDKRPDRFFAALELLEARGVDFRLMVAGEHIDPQAPDFAAARERWTHQIIHWGFAPSRAAYAALLHRADVVASAADQEFFGMAVVEALFCGCYPVLPRRLNYPDLLPTDLHDGCLYDGDAPALADALVSALALARSTPRTTWRAIAEPYDWSTMAPPYDEVFAQLARQRS